MRPTKAAAVLAALLASPVGAAPLPRKVLTLYRTSFIPGEVKDTFFLPTHEQLEMPLNWLGLDLEHVDVEKALPSPSALAGVVGVILWLPSTHAFPDPRPVCRWLDAAMRSNVKVVLFGQVGFHRPGASGTPDVDPECKTMLSTLGLSYGGIRRFDPLDVKVTASDPKMMGFERKLDLNDAGELPMVRLAPGATPYLRLEFSDERDLRAEPVGLTPRGGVALSPVFFYSNDQLTPPRYAWVIDPFAFLADALGLKGLPRPDVTTVNGRRVYTSHIDGDGFFNVSELDRRKLSGQVFIEEFLKKRPASPFSISLIAGYYDLDLYKDEASLSLSREAMVRPNVEPAVHGYSHPLVWRTRAAALKIPRYKVSAQMETAGAAKVLDERVMRTGRPLGLYFWTGDCLPLEEDLKAAADAGLLAINGGGGRFDAARPSYAYLHPLSRQVGALRQLYSPSSNENAFTNLWSGPYYGYRDAIPTFERTGAPRRVKPVDIYVHFYSAEKFAAVAALRSVYDWAHAQPLFPMFMGRYAASVRDFFALRIDRTGPGRYRLGGGPAVRTLRFDDPVGEPDLAASKGVIGFKRELGSLYVHLGDSEPRELVLARRPPALPRIEDANFDVSGWEAGPERVRFLKSGWWKSDCVLAGLAPGRSYRVKGAGLDATLKAGADGRLRVFFPDSERGGRPREVTVEALR
ncbi:hypothetical protein EPO15_01875 [bacterium]|nr:MAG: hypothetical protein EPO15_01875 [bacterium]